MPVQMAVMTDSSNKQTVSIKAEKVSFALELNT